MSLLERLIQKITSHSAHIGIVGLGYVGLGYVGLPLSIRFAEAGFKVLGLDIDATKPPQLNAGRSYIRHIPGECIAGAVAAGFEVTTRKRSLILYRDKR